MSARTHALAFGAPSGDALRQRALALTRLLEGADAARTADLCRSVPLAARGPERAVVLGSDAEALREQLSALAHGGGSDVPGLLLRASEAASAGTAIVLPAHAEWDGAAQSLLVEDPIVASAADACDRALAPALGWSPLERLAAGEEPGQAELFALLVGLARRWRVWGGPWKNVLAAGPGRLAAAHIAGELTLERAARALEQCRGVNGGDAERATRDAESKARESGADVVVLLGPCTPSENGGCEVAALRPDCDDRVALLEALGTAYVHGEDVDWRAVAPAGARPVPVDELAAEPGARRQAARASSNGRPDAADWVHERTAELLGIARDSLPADRSLTTFGLDSLMAVELQDAVLERFGVEIDLGDLLAGQSVADVAESVRAADAGANGSGPVAQPAREVLRPDPEHRYDPFPLHDVQHAYWLGREEAYELGGVSCHAYLELVADELDLGRLENALNRLIERHDMLRAIIEPDGTQRVLPEVPRYEPEVVDLRGDADAHAAVLRAREELSHEVRPADRWPLFTWRVLLLPDGGARVCVSLDLLVADGASLYAFGRELSALYLDPDADLPPIGVTFRDYMLAERRLESSPDVARAWSYWRDRLDTLPPAPALPLAVAPHALERTRFERLEAALEPDQWAALREQAAARGLTPSALLAAAFAEALRPWSAEDSFTLNMTTYARRPLHPDVSRLFGDFTALTLLEADGAGETFEGRALALQERLWSDLEHRQVNGVRVLRELARLRGAEHAAMPVVFTSLLGFDDDGDGFPMEAVGRLDHLVSQTPQIWLDHQVMVRDGRLVLSFDLVSGLLRPGVAESVLDELHGLLARLASGEAWEDERPVAIEERSRAFGARVARPEGLLWEGLMRAPAGDVAVVDGERHLTYGELRSRVEAVAAAVAGEPLVGISMRRGWEQVAAAHGVSRAGGAYVPLDPELPESRRASLAERCEVRTVLTQADVAARLQIPDGLRLVVVDDALPEPSEPLPPCPASPDDLAYVIFTSGSTGEPKGVMMSHRGALTTIEDIIRRFGVGPDDALLGLSSLSFDLSVFDVFGTLAAGARLVLLDEERRRDPAHWCELVEREGVTIWNSVPALMRIALERRERLADSLRLVMLSGDWIPVNLPEQLAQLSRAELVSLGGATEGGIWSIFHEVGGEPSDGWDSVPYGLALANQSMHVLDTGGRPCPDWVVGEIHIGGDALALGYWKDPERTAAAFIERDGRRLYRTGDLGRWRPEGPIEFLGRRDGQVKVGGHRIELGEIEAALLSHPALKAAVCAAPGPRENRRLHAYVVPREGCSAPSANALREHLAGLVPAYMVPTGYTELAELPLSSNGKVDRGALPDPQAVARRERSEPLPEMTLSDGAGHAEVLHAAAAAGKPVETVLAVALRARIAAQLEVPPESLDPDAPLNTVGLDSLMAVSLKVAVERDLAVDLPLALLTRGLTVRELAARLADGLGRAEAARTIDVDPDARHEPFPLDSIQEAYWLGRSTAFELGGTACHAYAEVAVEDLDLDRLTRALNRLIERHGMLRAVVEENGTQRVLPEVEWYEPEVVDLSACDPREEEAALASLRADLEHEMRPADLWPLFAWRVIHLSGGRARLCVSLDLLIADGASVLLLGRELAALYADPDAGLPPIGLSFRDYVLATRGRDDEDAWAYWSERLDALPDAPALPLAVSPAEIDTPRFRRIDSHVDASIWARLREQASERGLTPSGLLCAAFAETLRAWCSREAFTLNLTTYAREPLHADVDSLMGDFTSLELLGCDSHAATFEGRARALQEQLWQDLEHGGVDGIRLLRELVARRGRRRAAMPVVFTSTLGIGGEDAAPLAELGEMVYAVTQTPQVWLDHQVVPARGGVTLSFDVVDGLLADGVPEGVLTDYRELLDRLADGCAWSEAQPVARAVELAADDADRHQTANGERRTADGRAVDAGWLSELVAEVLEQPSVAPAASLLSLGATSLDMLRIAARLEHATGEAVELEDLFTAPSLSALASRLPQPVVA